MLADYYLIAAYNYRAKQLILMFKDPRYESRVSIMVVDSQQVESMTVASTGAYLNTSRQGLLGRPSCGVSYYI